MFRLRRTGLRVVVGCGATLIQGAFRKSGVPAWLLPTIGAVFIGGFGIVAPHVMSSGHAALLVVHDKESRRVIGLLTERYALRRYTEELEQQRHDLSGE